MTRNNSIISYISLFWFSFLILSLSVISPSYGSDNSEDDDWRFGNFTPIKQFKVGIPLDVVNCKTSFQILVKDDGSPACVKPGSVEKLIERGWATVLKTDSENFISSFKSIKLSNSDLLVYYYITDGNITSVNLNYKEKSIEILLEPTNQGLVTINVPKNVLDSIFGIDDEPSFIVVVDKDEVNFMDSRSAKGLTITAPFDTHSTMIHILPIIYISSSAPSR